MTVFAKDGFKDINPELFKTHPLQIIRSASLTGALVERLADYHDRPGAIRKVTYNAADYDVALELMMVAAPAGLSNLTNPSALSGTGGAPEGRLLYADGTFGFVSAEDAVDLYGWCFDSYYEFVKNRIVDDDAITQIEAGDWFWVIRKGVIEIKVGETNAGVTAVGDLLVTDDDSSHQEGGRLRSADAMAGPTAAQILENSPRKAVGVALEIGASENDLIYAKVDLSTFGAPIYDVSYP